MKAYSEYTHPYAYWVADAGNTHDSSFRRIDASRPAQPSRGRSDYRTLQNSNDSASATPTAHTPTRQPSPPVLRPRDAPMSTTSSSSLFDAAHPTGESPSSSGDSSSASPLLDLLERFPDLFKQEVLGRLDPAARASVSRVSCAFNDAVFPASIFPSGPPRAGTTGDAGAARVFKFKDFVVSVERLAWVGPGRRCLPRNSRTLNPHFLNITSTSHVASHMCPALSSGEGERVPVGWADVL